MKIVPTRLEYYVLLFHYICTMKNKQKPIAVIGDVHGCSDKLAELFEKIIIYTDAVYSVGDLIDRGPDSRGVIEFCIKNNIKPVMGNHENMLIKTFMNPRHFIIPGYETNKSMWLFNGGDSTIYNYNNKKSMSFSRFKSVFTECGHYDFISALPLKIELDNLIITHAGIVHGKPSEDMLWNRGKPSKLEKLQVFGHTPVDRVRHFPGFYINTDTGCVFNGKLSAVIIYPDNKVIILKT